MSMIQLPDSFAVGVDDDVYVFATAEEQQRVAAEALKVSDYVATFEVRNFEGTEGAVAGFAFDDADDVIADLGSVNETYASLMDALGLHRSVFDDDLSA